MKPNLLSRYITTEILPPFFFGLIAFTVILLVARIIKLIELVVTRGVPLAQIGKLFSLILPTFLEMTVPMAFLLAILLGIGRLSSDHEITAMKALGISPVQILLPVVVIATLICIATLALTMYLRPSAHMTLKRELFNVAKTRVSTALKEKVFNDEFPKVLIYVEEVIPPGDTAQGVLIVDRRDRNREAIILGKVALITSDEAAGNLGLRLFDGSIYERESKRQGFSQTKFNIYDFRLSFDELIGPVRMKADSPKEMPIKELWETIRLKASQPSEIIPERMELHQRIAFGFAPLVFALMGVSLSLLPRPSRAGRSWGFVLCLFGLLTYYGLLSIGKALGERAILAPALALWLPNIVLGLLSAYFFAKAMTDSPLYIQSRLELLVVRIRRRWRKDGAEGKGSIA